VHTGKLSRYDENFQSDILLHDLSSTSYTTTAEEPSTSYTSTAEEHSTSYTTTSVNIDTNTNIT
jgi:hypothetical protein